MRPYTHIPRKEIEEVAKNLPPFVWPHAPFFGGPKDGCICPAYGELYQVKHGAHEGRGWHIYTLSERGYEYRGLYTQPVTDLESLQDAALWTS